MEKHLLHILQEKSRVIIPEFGAVILKQRNPKKLIFNEFLQYNDGALINLVAEEEGIDRDEATRKVTAYVQELRKKLEEGKSIKLKEIGVLSQSSAGKIALDDASPEASVTPNTESVDANEEVIEPVEDEIEVEVETEQKVEAEDKVESKPEPEVEKKEEVKVEVKEPEVTATKPVQEKPKSPIPKVENKVEPPIKTYYADNSKRTKNILAIVGIILFNVCLVIAVLYFDDIKQIFQKDKSQEDITVIDELENATPENNDEVLPSAEIEVEGNIVDQASAHDEGAPTEEDKHYYATKYYVVAGVFGVEENADNLVKILKERGYPAEKFGKIGNLWGVCYNVFPTKSEADNFMRKIKESEDPEAWIRVVK